MSRPLLLGIDEGTSAVKVVAYDLDLRPLAEQARPVPTTHPRSGWVEQDPNAVLEAVVDAVAAVLDAVDGEVVACGLDHQGESVLAWDGETGAPLSPIVVWQDRRSQEVLRALRPPVAEEAKRLSGLPLDPYFSAGKLAWLLRHGGFPAGARLGTVDAFLTDRLGGVFATDPSTASRTQLARASTGAGAWDPRLCDIFGVQPGVLPEIADSAGALGTLRHPRWRQELPLTARVADQQAALAGSGCVVPGCVKATYGTGVFVLAHVGHEAPFGGVLLPTVAWRIGGTTDFALDGGVFSAGALLEWLSGEVGLGAGPAQVAAHAATVPDAGGVRLLPALSGVGAPWWRADATGLIAGLKRSTTRGHLARAALDAIAWRVADVVAAVAERSPIDVLRVDGGLTRDPLLLQLQADATGLPVERGLVDATAAGAAALAAVGAGVWPGLEAVAERLAPGERVLPQRDAAWREAEHTAWRAFVEKAAVF